MFIRLSAALLLCASVAAPASAQFDEALLKQFTWRSVGPAGAGGRVVDVAVAGDSPQRIYVATASGGVWTSTNQGTSWQPVFDSQSVSAIGDIAVDPSSPDTIWVGTGESNPRNSASWGDGVYKSTNAGRTWTNTGLKDTQHIGRVVVDPRQSNTVYVAAVGHLWGPNKERGVFKTTDGGVTWTHSLFIDDDTGVVDLVMDPNDSNTLLAAAYEVRRDAFEGGDPEKGWGPGSGIYKTSDAGKNWHKLTDGLPAGPLGRIGLDIARTRPSVVYAIVQTPTTTPRETTDESGPPAAPPAPKTMKDGGLFRSEDRGETWTWVNAIDPRPFYHSQVRIDPTNENHLYVLGSPIAESEDGGRTFHNQTWNIHVDHHALWIDPQQPRHMINGNDGGIYVTWDGGRSWDFQNQVALSQFYSVDVDMRRPYFIYGGVQDYCSWGGPSATRNSVGIKVSDWFKVQTGDGFQVRVDPTDYTIVYAESQYGGVVRHDLKSGRNTPIKPRARRSEKAYRFNWETPLLLSSHDPKTIYVGGNFLFRSANRGDAWTVISPELTTDKAGTISTFAESPIDANLLYVGTDDGNLHVTRDGGKTWKNVTSRVGVPPKRWVSRVIASRYAGGTAYVAFDGHRNNDFTAYLFKTTDFGESWKPVRGDLPASVPVRVVREDVKNERLLFAGTESAAYASLDDGAHWVRLMNGMPTVPIADLVVHPRDGELVAGTHGRSFYVMDIGPLQQLTPDVLAQDVHLFAVKGAVAFDYRVFTNDEFLAEKRFIAQNPAPGTTISYYLRNAASGDVKVAVLDGGGAVVRDLTATGNAGINRVQWDLRARPPVQTRRGAGQGGGIFGGPPQGALVDSGTYTVRLTVNGKEQTTPVMVEADPEVTISDADRRARRAVVDAVAALQAQTDPAAARADSAAEQLEALGKSVSSAPNLPAAVRDALASASKQAAASKNELSRTNRSVMQLLNQVNGSPFLPTLTERGELEDLQAEYRDQAAALDTLLKTTVPGIEKQLNDAGVPRVLVK